MCCELNEILKVFFIFTLELYTTEAAHHFMGSGICNNGAKGLQNGGWRKMRIPEMMVEM